MKVKDTTITACKMAVRKRPVVQSLIFHSDKGIHYACDEFRQELGAYKARSGEPIARTMQLLKASATADRFKTLKLECVYNYKFVDQQEAASAVFEYIEI